jgi:hypothetical protein
MMASRYPETLGKCYIQDMCIGRGISSQQTVLVGHRLKIFGSALVEHTDNSNVSMRQVLWTGILGRAVMRKEMRNIPSGVWGD